MESIKASGIDKLGIIYSVSDIEIKGKFPFKEANLVRVQIEGKETGRKLELEIKRFSDENIIAEIPAEIQSDNYNVIAKFDNNYIFSKIINIQGLPEEFLEKAREGECLGAGEEVSLSPIEETGALLYRSRVNCPGIEFSSGCFWEFVLVGNPSDSDQLFTTNSRVRRAFKSLDGGRTWSRAGLENPGQLFYGGDPKLIILEDGTVLLGSLIVAPHPNRVGPLITGGFYTGNIADS